MQKWIDFYRPFFPTDDAVREFVQVCEMLSPPNNVAKIMMHQGQRLVSLSDDMRTTQAHDEPLQLLFLMMCAENIAKLHDGFHCEGQSRAYVRRFFESFLDPSDQDTLGRAFTDDSHDREPLLSLRKAVDLLYDVRCDVIHAGNYSDFTFCDGGVPMQGTDPHATSYIAFETFREIVVRGCINAVRRLLPAP